MQISSFIYTIMTLEFHILGLTGKFFMNKYFFPLRLF